MLPVRLSAKRPASGANPGLSGGALSPIRVILLRVARRATAHVSRSIHNEGNEENQAERPGVVVPKEVTDKSEADNSQNHPIQALPNFGLSSRIDHLHIMLHHAR